MTTISFKPGATGPFVVRLEAEDGDPVAYVRTQIRVQAGAACLTAWQSALIVSVGYLLMWEGAQVAFFGGGIADGFVDAAAVTCGAIVAAGAWRNKGAAVAGALALLAVIGVAGVRKRR